MKLAIVVLLILVIGFFFPAVIGTVLAHLFAVVAFILATMVSYWYVTLILVLLYLVVKK